MAITPENITRHELIGLKAKVEKSRNNSASGISGKIVDETRNTLVMETKKGEKKTVKNDTLYSFVLPSKAKVEVEGKLIVGRPEERLKKNMAVKKRW